MVHTASELRIRGLERVTRIELALSAWESVPSGPVMRPDLQVSLSASDHERPLVTGANGPLMARRPALMPCSSPILLDSLPLNRTDARLTRREDQARQTLPLTLGS
jgi:hypothetical protein